MKNVLRINLLDIILFYACMCGSKSVFDSNRVTHRGGVKVLHFWQRHIKEILSYYLKIEQYYQPHSAIVMRMNLYF